MQKKKKKRKKPANKLNDLLSVQTKNIFLGKKRDKVK